MKIKTYTGGLAATNAYLVETEKGWLSIDAPEGFCDRLREWGIKPEALVLTHGHWDHMWDAAELAEYAGCPVYYHQADELLMTQPDVMRNFGLPVKLRPVQKTGFLAEGDVFKAEPWKFEILHIPGHCPGSICLYEKSQGTLFGGDVLFAGGVGRWDLPGGSARVLREGIRKKLLPLPEETVVYPGHGEATTVGEEKETNPYLQESFQDWD